MDSLEQSEKEIVEWIENSTTGEGDMCAVVLPADENGLYQLQFVKEFWKKAVDILT